MKEIVEMTPFIYEDGQIYYFNITNRPTSRDYHDLWVYESVQKRTLFPYFFLKKKNILSVINENRPLLVNINLNTNEIKNEISILLKSRRLKQWKKENWDGFIGDIPLHIKRDSKIENLLK
jgi:hypothetical protein